jgi:hypothetical protein
MPHVKWGRARAHSGRPALPPRRRGPCGAGAWAPPHDPPHARRPHCFGLAFGNRCTDKTSSPAVRGAPLAALAPGFRRFAFSLNRGEAPKRRPQRCRVVRCTFHAAPHGHIAAATGCGPPCGCVRRGRRSKCNGIEGFALLASGKCACNCEQMIARGSDFSADWAGFLS